MINIDKMFTNIITFFLQSITIIMKGVGCKTFVDPWRQKFKHGSETTSLLYWLAHLPTYVHEVPALFRIAHLIVYLTQFFFDDCTPKQIIGTLYIIL